MPRRALLRLFALALLLFPVAPTPAATPRRLVATTGMVADIVQRVAGDRAEVTGLIAAGIDPHLYSPTRADLATLMRADAVFYNGLLLQGKMTDALVRAATSGRPVFAVTERLPEDLLLTPEGFEGHADPHLWMDPTAWAAAVEVVRDRLTELDAAECPRRYLALSWGRRRLRPAPKSFGHSGSRRCSSAYIDASGSTALNHATCDAFRPFWRQQRLTPCHLPRDAPEWRRVSVGLRTNKFTTCRSRR